MNKVHYDVRCASWGTFENCTMGIGSFVRSGRAVLPCDTFMPPSEEEPARYLEDVWTRYVDGWLTSKIESVHLARHEDFLTDAASAWRNVGLPLRASVAVPMRASKWHGAPLNFSQAQNKLTIAPTFVVAPRVCDRTRHMRLRLRYRCG
jgi:hypothetical protein